MKYLLCYAFLLLFILPLVFIQVMSYYNNVNMVKYTMQEAANQNLMQTQQNLQLALSSYDYMIYQLYTDRKLIDLLDALNREDDTEANSLRVTQLLSSAIYGQSYVQAITVITRNGQVLLFDRLKGSQNKYNWLQGANMPVSYIYGQTISHTQSYMFSTTSGKDFSGQVYHYFHIAHSIQDYRNVQKQHGIVILSVDVDVLNKGCNVSQAYQKQQDRQSFCFILDQNNNIVCFPDAAFIGKNILQPNDQGIREACREFIYRNHIMEGDDLDVQVLNDSRFDWKIVRVSNNHDLMEYINKQYQTVVLGMFLAAVLLGSIMLFLNRKVIRYLNRLLEDMKLSANEELISSGQHSFIKEMDGLHKNFNHMLRRINALIERIKCMTRQQKDAEIKALEAQINPHFLYNSLDMINWMAIDAGKYQISDAVHLLAQILRYAITGINEPVHIAQEVEWMHRYLQLQQMKGRDSFQYRIEMEPGICNYLIYKMLMQPFMENAIIHGFVHSSGKAMLIIKLEQQGDTIHILIEDNGVGIDTQMLDELRHKISDPQKYVGSHIGIYNVCNRLQLYYGTKAALTVESTIGIGTRIMLSIPVCKEVKK